MDSSPLQEMLSPDFVFKIGKFGAILIALGVVLKVVEKFKPAVASKCTTCGRSIALDAVPTSPE